eukprot:gb/GFBE01078455.1/.p1 GENE.gb/GFBE01078455.1/~~gb/GFBE01078455.1/.p1  ORF type:complete len:408 (+),score=53.30 gb/GFBE01078455.1/:1-1224(+)
MAQTLDLANELQGLVVRNTFLDFPDAETGGLGQDLPRTRAYSDMTDTKLPWKVPISEGPGNQLFQITRHRICSETNYECQSTMPGETPLSTVSEERSEISPTDSFLSNPMRNDPFHLNASAFADALQMPPLVGLPGFPPPPWWLGGTGVPPWAAASFPVWGGYPAYPPSGQAARAAAAAAAAASLGPVPREDMEGRMQGGRRGSGRGRKDSIDSPLVNASEGRPARKGSGRKDSGTPAVPAAVGQQVKSDKISQPSGDRTTVMLRHIPNRYSSLQLVDLLDRNGFKAKFDFVYLPMDFQNKVNLGYCFVNLISHECALAFQEAFNGFSDWRFDSSKASEVSWAHPHQGLEEHIDRYRNSPVMHSSMPAEYKPMIFRNGQQIPFPAPTRSIKAPKVRVHRDRQGAKEA